MVNEKINRETPEVRSDERKPREEREGRVKKKKEKKEKKENARNYIYIAVHTLMCEELGCVSQVKLIPEIPL